MSEDYQYPAFPKPDSDGAKLWRYIDFLKFEWLIENKRLFMSSAKYLGDPLEGTEPVGNDVWWSALIRNAPTNKQKRIIRENKEKLSKFGVAFRDHYYVSCWHINENENNRMWHTYTQSSESIAIQTTFKILRSLLPEYVDLGVVRYIDYDNESLPSLNMFEYITHKHVEFCFERELRAVVFPPSMPELGCDHFKSKLFEKEDNPEFKVFAPEIDLQKLICSITFHPKSSISFKRKIIEMCNRNSLPEPVNSLFDNSDV